MVGLLRFISGGKKYTNKLLFWICVPLRKPRSVTEMISKDECEHFCAVCAHITFCQNNYLHLSTF